MSPSHVALISPYDAGNLGDAAILESVSASLRTLEPGCRLTAVTLAPAAMADYHGLPGWPITGASVEFYAISPAPSAPASQPLANPSPAMQTGGLTEQTAVVHGSPEELPAEARRSPGLASRIGRLPLVGPMLRKLRDVVRFARADIRHWRDSYAWLGTVTHVMVAGGGQFDDEWGGAWGHPYALFKWSVLARMRGIPFVVPSVGVCRTEDRMARFFFARAMRNANWLSFRDAASRERALAIEPRTLGRMAPDLAFALNPGRDASPSRDLDPRPARAGLRIGVSPIAYRMPGAWPIPDEARFEQYLQVLLDLIESLRAQGHEVVLFTSERTDRDVVERVQRQLEKPGVPRFESVLPDRLDELLGALASFDLIITSRLHGIILSHVLGKPAAALSYDRKVRAHMQDMGQERYCLDIDSPELANAIPMVRSLIDERNAAAIAVSSALAPRRAEVVDQYAQMMRIGAAGQVLNGHA